MRFQPVLVDFEAEPRFFGDGEHTVPHDGRGALRHLFFIATEGTERIFHLEDVLRGRIEGLGPL